MRWLVLVVLAACGGPAPVDPDGTPVPPVTPLHLDVLVYPDHVLVYANTPGVDDQCVNPFPAVGTNDFESDGLYCEHPPAPWLARVETRQDGATLESYDWWPPLWPYLHVSGYPSNLVLMPIDGDEIEIPITAGPTLTATIDDVVDDGITTTVAWSSSGPVASAIALLSGGFGGERHHVPAGEAVTFGHVTLAIGLSLSALAAPVTVPTPIGDATLWYAAAAYRDLSPP